MLFHFYFAATVLSTWLLTAMMTSLCDEDLRCFATMQRYPNSSAMLIRSIIKQVNLRLEGLLWVKSLLLQRTGGISLLQEQQTCTLRRLCSWNDGRQSYISTSNTLTSTNNFCYQKCVLQVPSLLLGWTDNWSLGSRNTICAWTSSTG